MRLASQTGADRGYGSAKPTVDRYRHIVDRAEKFARRNLGKSNLVVLLSEAMGVSARTLSRAFRAARGTTPSRYLRALRLAEARKALLSAYPEAENVTDIAMRFGFRELGRFAVEYRKAYGESPSATLHRTCK